MCRSKICLKKPFNLIERRSEPLGLIHSDICDPKFVHTLGGKKYITFIDDHSRYRYTYFLSNKDGALDAFVTSKNENENQLGKKIKVLRSNRDDEYNSSDFDKLCAKFDIIHQMTALHTP